MCVAHVYTGSVRRVGYIACNLAAQLSNVKTRNESSPGSYKEATGAMDVPEVQ